jgi:hypothetical protein
MWYTVESDKSTIRDEGELVCQLTYNKLRKAFQLPPFDAVSDGLSGDLSSLMQWNQDTKGRVLPFTFEKDKRIKFDLLSKSDNVVVGTVWYGASKTLCATFSRTSDAKEILSMFYQHWLIYYGALNAEQTTMSIREIVGKL